MKPKILSAMVVTLTVALLSLSFTASAQSVAVPAVRIQAVVPAGGQPATIVANPLALPPEVQAMMEKMSATNLVAGGTGTNSAKAGEPKDLATAIKTMKFERTPEALFEVVKSSQQDGGKSSEVDKFRMAVLLGDWESVGRALGGLPAGEGMKAYSRLLESLATNSQSVVQHFQQRPMQPDQPMVVDGQVVEPGGQPRKKDQRALFLSEDYYAVLAAAPGELEAAHLPHITSLTKLAIGASGRKEFIARLAKGLNGIGGETTSGKKLAAQLLSSVGWMSDAGPYLPLQREEWDQADTLMLVLTMEHYTLTGMEKRDERQVKRAVELCAFMMQTSRFDTSDRSLFRQATDRFVKLLPALDPAEAEQLIRENFLTQPAILNELILALGESGQQAQRASDMNRRGQSLATQNILLRVLAGRKSALPESVNVIVMNWLGEAETTYRAGTMPQQTYDDYDNPFIYRPPSYYMMRNQQMNVLNSDLIMTNAPPPALVKKLNRGLSQRVNLTLVKVNLMNPKEIVTLETLQGYLKDHPGSEKELCQEYLTAWTKKRMVAQEDPNIVRMRNMGYIISRPQSLSGGIPLTRLRQNQNVTEFKNLLESLRALSPEPIDASAVVNAFMAIHSGAEVYRAGDIEAIFGPAEKMNRTELMQLITGMRTKLREQWQDPQVQQAAGSNRTEQEVKDEVSRGYRTALDLARRGLTTEGAEWKQYIVRGQLFFDAAEYEFSRQVKLTEYVSLRDEAFSSYSKAGQLYAAKVPEMAKGQWTIEPYQMWFIVMLGASDLQQLTRAAARSDPGLTQIGDAMRALPGEAGEGHLLKFGQMLSDLLKQVPANMKQRFLSAGLQVVGTDHPGAKVAQQALKNYEELLDEVQLRVTVDGPTRVGHAQPFGMVLSLEHTRQLGRESGGFGKYVQNASQQQRGMQIYMPAGNPGQRGNLRDDFSKNIHGALDETFEILSITFQDGSARAMDLPREGWQETPLAYVLLRAKEAAVDRIPSMQLDMDFSDTAGQVVLPVRSQVQPLDAKDAESPARPCADLALTFTMDEREWREGRVVVEVSAKGRGVIPAHPQMFEFSQPGFDCEVSDNGLSITEFVSDGKMLSAQADRNWQFTYKRKKDLRGDVVLNFPVIRSGIVTTNTEYKHYQEADLVTLDSKAALAGVTLASVTSSGLRTGGIVVGLAVVAGVVVWLGRSRRRRQHVAVAGLALPESITPFSVVAFLRRIQHNSGSRFSENDRAALHSQIGEIESTFFSNGEPKDGKLNLEAIARKWLQAAS